MSVIDLKDVPVGGGDPSTGLDGRSPSPASRGGFAEERIAAGPPAPRNDRIVDVPMRAQRSLATVTAEILSYQEAARRMVITYSIEIGRRLIEAKGMVDHGDWGRYLREELGFSQSTANNHMAMFRAYAADQMRMDGDNLKNQAFGNLTYTQALALLALPSEEEREAFVETHDLASMSTRELQEELKNRQQATGNRQQGTGDAEARIAELTQAKEAADKQCLTLQEENRVVGERYDAAMEEIRARDIREENMKDEIRTAETKQTEAEAKANEAAKKMLELRSEIEKAKAREKKLKADLERAKQNPTIPKETMDKLRAEAEEAARKAVEAENKTGELDAAKARYEAAELEASKARQEAETVAESLAALQKELRLAAPEMAAFRVRFDAAQEALNKAVDALWELSSDKVDGGVRAFRALLERIGKRLEEDRYEAAMPE